MSKSGYDAGMLIIESWGDDNEAGVVREDGARARVWFHKAQHVWERDEWRAEAGPSASEVRRVELDEDSVQELGWYGALCWLVPGLDGEDDEVRLLIESAPHGTTDRSKGYADVKELWQVATADDIERDMQASWKGVRALDMYGPKAYRELYESCPLVQEKRNDSLTLEQDKPNEGMRLAVEVAKAQTRTLDAALKRAKTKPWWHKLEAGDVFLSAGGCEREVRRVADEGVVANGLLWGYQMSIWPDCTPPLHLDPEWYKRAPVGTKLVDEPTGVLWEVRRMWDGSTYCAGSDHGCSYNFTVAIDLRPLSPRELEAQS